MLDDQLTPGLDGNPRGATSVHAVQDLTQEQSPQEPLGVDRFSTQTCSEHLLLVLCLEYLRPSTSSSACPTPQLLCGLLLMTNTCDLMRTSRGVLQQLPCTHKEQEVPGRWHHPGTSRRPGWAGMRRLKLSPLSLRWDSFSMESTLQSSLQDLAKTGLSQKPHRYLAFFPFLPCSADSLPVSPGNMSLINHFHMKPYLSVCFLVTLPKARSNSIIKREIAQGCAFSQHCKNE